MIRLLSSAPFFNLPALSAYKGDFGGAHELLEEVVPLCDRLGLLDHLAVAQDIVIWMKINLGDYASARPLALANLGRLRQIGNARATGVELLGSGEIALAEGRLADALALLTESADALGQIGQRDEQGLALAHLAALASLMGQPEQARRHLRQALQAASDDGSTLRRASPAWSRQPFVWPARVRQSGLLSCTASRRVIPMSATRGSGMTSRGSASLQWPRPCRRKRSRRRRRAAGRAISDSPWRSWSASSAGRIGTNVGICR